MRLTSPDFDGGGELSADLTCDGRGRSPALEISGVPDGAAELAVVASDPDAPGGTYYHGAVYGLDPDTSEIPAGGVPDGAEVAANDAGTAGYAAPCPPEGDGPHHYTFSVYAVDQPLGLTNGADAAEVASAAEAAAVANASVSAAYER
jgi:Raf kinase inhibitor-like YbhB/YbcL family protein